MIYNVGYILLFDCMIIIYIIFYINSFLYILLYIFYYIDIGIIYIIIKYFEIIFYKLSMLYCLFWYFGSFKLIFYFFNWIR